MKLIYKNSQGNYKIMLNTGQVLLFNERDHVILAHWVYHIVMYDGYSQAF